MARMMRPFARKMTTHHLPAYLAEHRIQRRNLMKPSLLVLICLLGCFRLGFAQNGESERLEPMRIAFITRALNLSSEEAKVFWPVYEEYKEELGSLTREKNRLQRELRQEMMSGNENKIESMSDEFIDISRKQYQLQETYHEQFKAILPIRKVVLLYKAEQDFNRRLLEELKKRRDERQKNQR